MEYIIKKVGSKYFIGTFRTFTPKKVRFWHKEQKPVTTFQVVAYDGTLINFDSCRPLKPPMQSFKSLESAQDMITYLKKEKIVRIQYFNEKGYQIYGRE